MLTADLVDARRRGSELLLRKLDDKTKAKALELAKSLVGIYEASVGVSRDELEAALATVEVAPAEQRLKDGLAKLLEDRAAFDLANGMDPEEVRRAVFLEATRVRRSLEPGSRFDRDALVAGVACRFETDAASLDRALFADLRGAGILSGFDPISPAGLVSAYERGQAQAVLLRAVRIKVGVVCASPGVARALFRRLKFLGLLHTIAPADLGYDIVIDGPLSLFESVTKYGQKMALVLPLLEGCESWTLEADVRWGKQRTPLMFRAAGGTSTPDVEEPPLPDDIAAFARAFGELGSAWKVGPSRVVLELPGIGLSVPDLVFRRGKEKIYFEVMGFWSREAVFRRVELVERGLSEKVLFAVSSRLRVSEEVLAEDASGALYVYKGAMSARSVAERLERLSR